MEALMIQIPPQLSLWKIPFLTVPVKKASACTNRCFIVLLIQTSGVDVRDTGLQNHTGNVDKNPA
jgi:hypothetical protein